MQAGAFREVANDRYEEDLDRVDILEAVASLRHELNLVANDIRSVISENARLRQELDGMRSPRERAPRVSEVHRIKDEIDHLIRMHEAVSGERSRARQERPVQRSGGCECEERSERMKKMFMMMMMAELF
jgi:hypothetical protein